MNTENIHFAWDKYEDADLMLKKFKMVKEILELPKQQLTVYMLTNFDTSHEQDLERVYTIRDAGFNPYVMIYNKDDFVVTDKNGKPIKRKPIEQLLKKYSIEQVEHFEKCWAIQRWVNNRRIFNTCMKYEDFGKNQNVL